MDREIVLRIHSSNGKKKAITEVCKNINEFNLNYIATLLMYSIFLEISKKY